MRPERARARAGAGAIRIGISGWRYAPWRGRFYPEGLVHRRELEYAAERFATIELNGSFYSLQTPGAYATWHGQTPPGFVFAVKGSRYITHILRLRGVERALANLYASGVFNLQEKLGPFLWQFPPNMPFDAGRFEAFLQLLPRDTDAAAALARRRDARLNGRARLVAGANRPLRHAVQVRHESFADPAFVRLLRRHNVALVFADGAGPSLEDLTADFVYVRLHGRTGDDARGYSAAALRRWAQRIRTWRRARDVYCYFEGDAQAHAPYDARSLARMLGLDAGLAAMPD